MQYNGLKDDLNSLAKFVYIYETEIKNMPGGLKDFSHRHIEAYNIFMKKKLNRKMKYATTKEIVSLTGSEKFTFHMTKHRFQIWDLCRHLRNSFAHGLLSISENHIEIADKHLGRITAVGYLDYASVKEFVIGIINEYENNK